MHSTDVDECSGENECHGNATCVNNIGSYNCSCKTGFTGNGTYCQGTMNCIKFRLL